jgi:hypothetical protein
MITTAEYPKRRAKRMEKQLLQLQKIKIPNLSRNQSQNPPRIK